MLVFKSKEFVTQSVLRQAHSLYPSVYSAEHVLVLPSSRRIGPLSVFELWPFRLEINV